MNQTLIVWEATISQPAADDSKRPAPFFESGSASRARVAPLDPTLKRQAGFGSGDRRNTPGARTSEPPISNSVGSRGSSTTDFTSKSSHEFCRARRSRTPSNPRLKYLPRLPPRTRTACARLDTCDSSSGALRDLADNTDRHPLILGYAEHSCDGDARPPPPLSPPVCSASRPGSLFPTGGRDRHRRSGHLRQNTLVDRLVDVRSTARFSR